MGQIKLFHNNVDTATFDFDPVWPAERAESFMEGGTHAPTKL